MTSMIDVFKVSKDKGFSLYGNYGLLSDKGKFKLIEKEEEVFHTNEKVLFFAEFNLLSEPGTTSILKFTNLKKIRSVPSEDFFLYFYITNERFVFFVRTDEGHFCATSFTPKEEAFHALQYKWEKSKSKEDDWKIHLTIFVQGFYKPVILGCETNKSLLYCRRTFKEASTTLVSH